MTRPTSYSATACLLAAMAAAVFAAPASAFERGSLGATPMIDASAAEAITGIFEGTRKLKAATNLDDETLSAIIRDLSSSNTKARIVAMFKLHDYGAKARRSIPALILLLKDQEKPVRDMAEATLRVMGNPDESSLGELLDLIEDPDPRVYLTAEKALLSFGERGQLIVDARRQQRAEEEAERERLDRERAERQEKEKLEQERRERERRAEAEAERLRREREESAREEALKKKWHCTATCFYTTRTRGWMPSGKEVSSTSTSDTTRWATVSGCEDRSSAESRARGSLEAECEKWARSVTNEITSFYVGHRLASETISCN